MIICKQARTIEEVLVISNIMKDSGCEVFSILPSANSDLNYSIFANGSPGQEKFVEIQIHNMPGKLISNVTKSQSRFNNMTKE